MKKIVLLSVLSAIAFISNAQTVKLTKGQVLTVTSTMSQELDMGMAGQMNNSAKSTSVVEIKEADKNGYKANTKLSKLNISVDAMGEQQSYDSEKAEDRDSEMGKALGDKLGKDVNVTIDNNSGKVVAETKASPEREEKKDDPMAGLSSMFGSGESDAATAESIIFVLPKDKKAGDSWQDSSEVKNNSKVYKTYTLKSLQDGIATLAVATTTNGKNTVEAQGGMQIDMTMLIKSDAELIVDANTSIIKKVNRTTNVDGTMEVMGQSMPITSKTTEVTEIK